MQKRKPGRPEGTPKYEEAKSEKYNLRLTPLAKNWLQEQGGADYIEKLARDEILAEDDFD